MADEDESRPSELRENLSYTGQIDPGIEKILAKLDAEPKSNIVDELDEDYEMDILLETREIIFKHALAKLERGCLPIPIEGSTTHGVRIKAAETDNMTLIGRRVKHKVIEDIIQLMNYVSEQTGYFPFKIVKKGKKVCEIEEGSIRKFVAETETIEGGEKENAGNPQEAEGETEMNEPEVSDTQPVTIQANSPEGVLNGNHDEPEKHTLQREIPGETTATGGPDDVPHKEEVEFLCHECGCRKINGVQVERTVVPTVECEPPKERKKCVSIATGPDLVQAGIDMDTQTDFEIIDLSQPVPDEQVGIEAVLAEMDERSGRIEQKANAALKDLKEVKDKVRAMHNWRNEKAKVDSDRDRAHSSKYTDVKKNQLTLIKEVNWLREVILKAGLASDDDRKKEGAGERTEKGAGGSQMRKPAETQDVAKYESIWDIGKPNQPPKKQSVNANPTQSVSKGGAVTNQTQRNTSKVDPNSALGKYLAQRKLANPSTYPEAGLCSDSVRPTEGKAPSSIDLTKSDTERGGTMNNPRGQGNSLKGKFGGRDNPVQCNIDGSIKSNNLLNLADIRETKATDKEVASGSKRSDEQVPQPQGGPGKPTTEGGERAKSTSWADEVSDREMAAFYFDQRTAKQNYDSMSNTSRLTTHAGENNEKSGGRASDTNDGGTAVSHDRGSESADDSSGGESYSEVASKHPWSPPVSNNKRKWDRRDRKPQLKGVEQQPHKEIYVQGISTEGLLTKEEVISMIKDYCRAAGVIPGQAVVIPVRDDDTQTGCKVTVREYDAEKLMADGFWPGGISARPWRFKPKPNDALNKKGAANNESKE